MSSGTLCYVARGAHPVRGAEHDSSGFIAYLLCINMTMLLHLQIQLHRDLIGTCQNIGTRQNSSEQLHSRPTLDYTLSILLHVVVYRLNQAASRR
jgi:hypothetical protein